MDNYSERNEPKIKDRFSAEKTKICRICSEEKPLSEYQFRNDSQKYRNECKSCRDKYLADYRAAHKERVAELNKKYRELHRDRLNEYSKKYQKAHLDKFREYNKKARENWTEEQRAQANERSQRFREKRKDDPGYREKRKQWNRESSLRRRKKITAYEEERKRRDPVFKLKKQIRNDIRAAFKRRGFNKSTTAENIIGCDIEYLQRYLCMTYSIRYGKEWDGVSPVHIDHIKPLANAVTENEVYELCHYTNLQLLRPEDNLIKHDSNKPDSWEQYIGDNQDILQ